MARDDVYHAADRVGSVQRVVQGPKIWIHFFLQVAGQKAETFAGFDCRTRKYDAAHPL